MLGECREECFADQGLEDGVVGGFKKSGPLFRLAQMGLGLFRKIPAEALFRLFFPGAELVLLRRNLLRQGGFPFLSPELGPLLLGGYARLNLLLDPESFFQHIGGHGSLLSEPLKKNIEVIGRAQPSSRGKRLKISP